MMLEASLLKVIIWYMECGFFSIDLNNKRKAFSIFSN